MANTKRAIWCSLLSIQNGAISLVAMRSKELWLVQENHATVKLDVNCFSWKENVPQKQNWTAESTNLKEIVEKITAVFVIRAALWAENLGCDGWIFFCCDRTFSCKYDFHLLLFSTNIQGPCVKPSFEFTVAESSSWANYSTYHSFCKCLHVMYDCYPCLLHYSW